MGEIDRLAVKTLADQALESIEAAIVRGELAPGTRLSDHALARSLGISRGPVREAIQRLEGRKLVTRTPHVGTMIIALSWEDLVEIFTVREALEGVACRLAATAMTAEEIAGLRDLLASHPGPHDTRSGLACYQQAANLDFHYRIARGSKNTRLTSLLCDDLYYVLRIYRAQTGLAAALAGQAHEEHRHILTALEAHDGARAESLMRAHIAGALALIEEKRRAGAVLGASAFRPGAGSATTTRGHDGR
jgi:DNA-binding GntR family transcriptional regulator